MRQGTVCHCYLICSLKGCDTSQSCSISVAGRVKEVMKLIKRAGYVWASLPQLETRMGLIWCCICRNPDVVDEDGRTCLMHAVDCHQDTVVHLLLDVCGADPNYRTVSRTSFESEGLLQQQGRPLSINFICSRILME